MNSNKIKTKIKEQVPKIVEKIKFRKNVFFLWFLIIFIISILFVIKKDLFDINFLNYFVTNNKFLAIIIYIFLLTLIGITLIPTTPFAIAGLLFFSPLETFIYNLIAIIGAMTIIYYFSQYVGLDKLLEKKYPKQIIKLKKTLKNKMIFIIVLWSFMPFVATDLIIYVASSLDIQYRKCFFGVLIGEGILNFLYIFASHSIIGFFI
jgi:uncharacterized membrane protein YdjX (TVP38/TMEM64 family)